jgi:hypothetical protein
MRAAGDGHRQEALSLLRLAGTENITDGVHLSAGLLLGAAAEILGAGGP